MSDSFDFYSNTKTEAFQIADHVFSKLQASMKRGMKLTDDAASECEAVLSDGAIVTLNGERVQVTPEQVKQALGENAFVQIEFFVKTMRAALGAVKYTKKARPTHSGIRIVDATPEQIEAARQAHVGAAGLVQPSSVQLGKEPPLQRMTLKAPSTSKLTKAKKSDLVQPDEPRS